MPAPERIVVEIEREEDAPTYRAAIYGLGLGSRPTLVEHLRLHREVSIPLRDLQERDVSTTLAELEKRLFPASPNDAAESLAYFDDSVQLSFGQFLFRELFASCHSQGELHRLAEREGQELRIVTKDEFLIRLPWILLASDEGISLARLKRWSVSLAARRDPLDVPLPNFPKVLIAVPEPKGPRFDATRGEEHAGVLREYLSGIDVRYGWPEYLRVVRSWADFESALGQMQPEIVYFYGHGQGDLESSGLLFENQNGSPIEVTMTQLAATLNERARGAVKLLYLNCCSGDSGGLLGAGMQLRAIVPALLTNRTFAWAGVAREVGETFFKELFGERASPAVAYAAICRKIFLPSEATRSGQAVNWMIPVLHANYNDWQPAGLKAALQEKSPEQPKSNVDLSHFDRFYQVGMLNQHLAPITERGGLSPRVVLWHGAARQGVRAFHQHVARELGRHIGPIVPLSELAWPLGAFDLDADNQIEESIRVALHEVFDAPAELVTQQLLARYQGNPPSERKSCYVRASLKLGGRSGAQLTTGLKVLRVLVELWDEEWAPRFELPFVPFLGLALEVEEVHAFSQELRLWEAALRLRHIRPLRLEALGAVPEIELETHLGDCDRRLIATEIAEVARAILADTGGCYDDVVAVLQDKDRLRALKGRARFPTARAS